MGKGGNVMENQVMSYNPYILLYLETACSLQEAVSVAFARNTLLGVDNPPIDP